MWTMVVKKKTTALTQKWKTIKCVVCGVCNVHCGHTLSVNPFNRHHYCIFQFQLKFTVSLFSVCVYVFSSFSLHLVRFFISTDCYTIFRSSWRHCFFFCVLHDFQYYNKTSYKFLTNKENSPSFQLVVLCKSFEYLFIWIFVP